MDIELIKYSDEWNNSGNKQTIGVTKCDQRHDPETCFGPKFAISQKNLKMTKIDHKFYLVLFNNFLDIIVSTLVDKICITSPIIEIIKYFLFLLHYSVYCLVIFGISCKLIILKKIHLINKKKFTNNNNFY